MLKLATSIRDKLTQIKSIYIGSNSKLHLFDSALLAHHTFPVSITESSYTAMNHSHQFLKTQVNDRVPVYGINTNFGDQVNLIEPTLNSADETYYHAIMKRQENIIKSLSCSLGNEVDPDIIRVTIMLRAHCLAQGYSGVDAQIIDSMIAFLNAGIVPVVRCYGSIGASGDLIPLGSIAACMLGLDVPVQYKNERMLAGDALRAAGLKKMIPQLRDGLSMINGTSFMTAISSLAIYDLSRLFNQMLIAIAVCLESMQVYNSAYQPLIHQLKGQTGQIHIAEFLCDFWEKSKLIQTEKTSFTGHERVQDYYSLRSVAQGFGPFYENLKLAITWIENEMNSINDNPIIDASNQKIFHSANFMGYYVTSACDMLKMDIAQASTWIHALLAIMVHSRKNKGLPTNLVNEPETNNGFRSMQLLAAAIAIQNRKFAQSHQSFMLPTEGDNQDVNSLGTHAAFDLRESVANLERLTAILLLAGTQALDLRGVENASDHAQQIYELIRATSPQLNQCRPMTEEINAVVSLLKKEIL